MLEVLDNYDWESAFGEANITVKPEPVINAKGISLEGINREAVAEVIGMVLGENDGPNWTGIFRLTDGRYISVCSGCDYTGWDCVAGGEIFVAHDLDSIQRFGLNEDERKRLKISLSKRTGRREVKP